MMELCIARGAKQNLRIFSHRVRPASKDVGLWLPMLYLLIAGREANSHTG